MRKLIVCSAAMANLIQDSVEELQDPPEPFDSRFSMLCLDGGHHPPPCSSCGYRSATTPLKRRSPTPSSYAHQDSITFSNPEPKPKKLFLDHHGTPNGFSKIQLPIPFDPSASLPPLLRSVSDPTQAHFVAAPVTFTPSFDHLIDSRPPVNPDHSPETLKPTAPSLTPLSTNKVSTNSTLPPLPWLPLCRTVSDPNPSVETVSGSPNKVGKANDLIKEESPDSKRLRRIKDRMKTMSQWWNEMLNEEEHEEAKEDNRITKDNNHATEKESEEEIEETVGVERVGDSLELHLKCQCGKGFEILLSGRSCFYKLL